MSAKSKQTVTSLKLQCKERGLKGYSTLKKEKLIQYLENPKSFRDQNNTPTLQQLKAECKERGLKGYSRLRKAELVEFLKDPEAFQLQK